MYIPKGYSEEQVLEVINNVLNSLAPFFQFGYHDTEDMKQEGFIFAMKGLENFDPEHASGCSLESFLYTHVRNRYLSMRRDKLHRNVPPCSQCAFRDEDPDFCVEFESKEECPRWVAWYKRNQAKQNLMEVCHASDCKNTFEDSGKDICLKLIEKELLDYVSKRIPLSLRADYRRFLDGAKLNKVRREAIIDAIKEIVKHHD